MQFTSTSHQDELTLEQLLEVVSRQSILPCNYTSVRLKRQFKSEVLLAVISSFEALIEKARESYGFSYPQIYVLNESGGATTIDSLKDMNSNKMYFVRQNIHLYCRLRRGATKVSMELDLPVDSMEEVYETAKANLFLSDPLIYFNDEKTEMTSVDEFKPGLWYVAKDRPQ
jgi:hypothetical protein